MGFDFDLFYREDQTPLVEACIAASKRRARALRIRWRTEHLDSNLLRCLVDGNGRRVDLLGYRLEQDLPTICEAVRDTRYQPAKRRRIGLGFAHIYLRGRHVDYDEPISLRGVSAPAFYFPPYDFTELFSTDELRVRLAITEKALADWYFGDLPAALTLEELHTAAELILDRLVNPRSKKMSFAELVDLAQHRGLFGPDHDPYEAARAILADPPTGQASANLLHELKDLRKKARHRGDMGFEPWLKEYWEDIALILERLADPTRPGATP